MPWTNRIRHTVTAVLAFFAITAAWSPVYAAQQVLTPSPTTIAVEPGSTGIEVTVGYDTNPSGQRTTGVGVSIYFDSTKLTFVSLTALYETNLFGITDVPAEIINDSSDEDGDSDTDKKAVIAYASFSGTWPADADTLPLNLFKVTFDATSATDAAKTAVNFVVDTAAGYTAVAPSVPTNSCFNCFSFDADADGATKAMSDGLLVARYLYGFTGSSLIDGAVASGAERSSAADIKSHLDTYASQLDIDGDGEGGALTDGLLLAKYLFGFRGDSLIDSVVGTSATRTSASDIGSYIHSRLGEGSVASGAPTFSGLVSAVSVAENQTAVLTVSAADPNGDDISYSLTGSDSSALSISSAGVITFDSAPDYETQSSYAIVINVTDGTYTTSQALAITVTDQNDAPEITGPTSLVAAAENQTAVASITATDADADTLTYSLTGTDASSFAVSSAGVITFVTAPDYETKPSYSFTINVSDGTLSDEQATTLSVTDVNETPTISGLAASITVAEGQTAVTTVSASDPESGSLTYALSGTDAASLSISSAGVITFDSAPDYATKSSYAVTVEVSDGTNTVSQALTINLTDVNDAPAFSGLAASVSAAENQTAVVTVSASDPQGDSLTYSLGGADAASLSISASGVITFNSAPDYELKSSYSVLVKVSDGSVTTSQALTINITNQNEIPTISNFSGAVSVAENQTAVTAVSAADPDGDTLTYSLAGTDASSFSITNVGVISFETPPDYENKSSYSITVKVSDGALTNSEDLTVTVTDRNEAPVISSLAASISVAENQTAVTTVSASDPESGTLSYSLSDTDSSSLSISTAGVITFDTAPDYETKTSYFVVVNVSDGTNTTAQSLTISVTDVAEAPTISGLASTISVAEHQTAVTTVSASDPQGDSLTYTLTGTDAASLTISSAGVITFVAAPDYVTKSSYSITVNVSDGTDTTSQALTITITDENDAPIFSGLAASISVAENQTAVTTVAATDADNDALTFTLSGTDAASFAINAAGVLTFNTAPDYDTKSSYAITLSVSDGTVSTSQALTINITDVNEAPTIVDLTSSISVYEGQTAVTTVSATDPENNTLTYSLSGTDSSSLSISSAGVITFNSAPDYETKSSYSVMVSVSDGTNVTDQWLTITIADEDEAPVISGLAASVSVAENQTAVVTVSASDPQSDSLTYSLTSTDASSFSISTTGVITFDTAPDYETKSVYLIVVNVSDGTNSTSQSLTVNVTDVDDAPAISGLASTISVAENQTAVVTVSASDPQGDDLTYTLTGTDASSFSISASGVITFDTAPDYETKSSYAITVNVSDGTNSTSQSVTINVTDQNEDPAISGLATSVSVAEGETAVTTVTATDIDGNDLTYSLTGTDAASFSISTSGAITFDTAPDYEIKSSYSITVNVSDGTNSTSQALTITITDGNEAPTISSLASSVTVAEGELTVVTVSASDPESDAITYSLSGDDASSFQIDSAGTITFSSAPDYESPTDSNTDNSYELTVSVSDGSLSNSQSLTVIVSNNAETYSISGTVQSNNFTVLDSDVPSENWGSGSNNSPGTAQNITPPAVIVGHLGTATVNGTTTDDLLDVYKITVSKHLVATLEVSNFSADNDLILNLYDEDGNFVEGAVTASSVKSLALPTSGTYYLVPINVKGQSKYVLSVSRITAAAVHNSSLTPYVKNEILSYVPQLSKLSVRTSPTYAPRKQRVEKFVSEIDTKVFGGSDLVSGLYQYDFDVTNLAETPSNNLDLLFEHSEFTFTKEQMEDIRFRTHVSYLQQLFPERNLSLNFLVQQHSSFSEDPKWADQWHFQEINLPQALNGIGQETRNVVVAVVDSGAPSQGSTAWDTSSFVTRGYDFVRNTNNGDGDGHDSDPTDPDAPESPWGSLSDVVSHGIHVSTTIAAINDGSNFNGMAVKVLPLRVFPSKKRKAGANTFEIMSAVLFAAGIDNFTGDKYSSSSDPVRVINLSLGGKAFVQWVCDVMLEVRDQGISVVASSGNNATDVVPNAISYPASCPGVISVAATDTTGLRAPYSDYNNMVDIAAPGGNTGININGDSLMDGVCAFAGDERTSCIDGTSMAAPQVSGAIALMYAINPELTPDQIDNLIATGKVSNDIGDTGYDIQHGYGLLDVAKAIENAAGSTSSITFAKVSPPAIDFGYSTNEKSITLSKVGTGSVNVESISFDDETGVSYVAGSDVDSDGYGTYTITIDRSAFPDGTYRNNMQFTMSDSTTVKTLMTYSDGTERPRADIDKIVALLLDEDGNRVGDVLWIDMNTGQNTFSFSSLPEGKYRILFSTDIDGDGYICSLGEVCGLAPQFGSNIPYLSLRGDISGVVVDVFPIGTLTMASSASTDTN